MASTHSQQFKYSPPRLRRLGKLVELTLWEDIITPNLDLADYSTEEPPEKKNKIS